MNKAEMSPQPKDKEALEVFAANYTAVHYCGSVITATSYSVCDLVYRSQGSYFAGR
jgi:hypothetical protein